MFKKILAFIACVAVASCIQVEESAELWNKAKIDSALIGSWKVVTKGQQMTSVATYKLVKNGSSLRLEFPPERKKPTPEVEMRSIKSKHYQFLITKGKNADGKDGMDGLIRYEVKGDTATIYEPKTKAVMEWAGMRKEGLDLFKRTPAKGAPVLIVARLDQKKLSALDAIPDGEKFWATQTLEKQK